MAKRYRVLMGVQEIAGHYSCLKEGFDEIGVESTFLSLNYEPFGYRPENNPAWANIINKVFQTISHKLQKNIFLKMLWMTILCPALVFPIFLWSLFRYNVFIFSTTSTYLMFLDLPILRLLGKKVYYVYHGSESRPFFLNGYHFRNTTKFGLAKAAFVSFIQKNLLAYIDFFSTATINIPPQSYFNKKSIINSYIIGFPYGKSQKFKKLKAQSLKTKYTESNCVNILHAPSKPIPKGTAYIREIIAILKEKGYAINYVEITGRPNYEVIEAIAKCDFVIDEIYSDTPMAGFAAEAAALGKPALIGSYFARDIRKVLSPELQPPSHFCLPSELLAGAEKLVKDSQYRKDLGDKALKFVEQSWSISAVASRYLKIFEGDIAADWWFNPQHLEYLNGCGFSEKDLQKNLHLYISFMSSKALFLGDKNKLRDNLQKFSETNGIESPSFQKS